MTRRCPHAEVQYCPLYVAAHVGGAGGCDDGKMGDGRCAVARGKNYERAVARLRVSVPGLVEGCEWREQAAVVRAQHARNLRLNGLH